MPDTTQPTGSVGDYLAEVRERWAKIVTVVARDDVVPQCPGERARIDDWRPDIPRLLAAVERVFAAHRNVDGRCSYCRNHLGQRVKWPCGEYQAISQALLGAG